MKVTLDRDLIDKLSNRGIVAYLAVTMADGTTATTAALAALVKSTAEHMREGLEELANVTDSQMVRKNARRWICGHAAPLGDAVQILDSGRYRMFLDDLKIYWDKINPDGPAFSMGGRDGLIIQRFLKDSDEWTQEDWRKALHNRALSVVRYGAASRTEPFFVWVGKLRSYYDSPLDKYGKPTNGGGNNHVRAIQQQDANRIAGREFIAAVRSRGGGAES